ncbi:MAG: type II and III secretion system protein family protein [Kiloniellaceae bacterium]
MARFPLIALLVAAGLLSALAPAAAQGTSREVTATTGSISIARHQGRLVRLARPATSVFIANPEIADVSVKSARMVYVFGKAPGKTTLFAVDRKENVVADLDVIITHDLETLRESIQSLLPAGGPVDVSSVNGAIVLSGSVATATDAENVNRLAARFIGENEEVINRLAVTEPNQVNLRVRVAEMSRTAIRQLGLNFDITEGDFSFTSGANFSQNAGALSGLGNVTLLGTQFGAGLLSGVGIGNATLNALFDALEEVGVAKTLAEPNLTALSGETASFLAGGEFPIPIAQDNNSISVEFKQFGVSLAFTPTVISKNRISMKVRPEVSQISNEGAVTIGGLNISALTTRRAETTIELGSGQSFAIAGLLQENMQDKVRQMPYLSDIPILGEMFKSEEFQRNESELIIIVTPYVVQPLARRDVPLPTDPLTRSQPRPNLTPPPAATLSRAVPVPNGGTQLGAAKYLLD